MNKWEKIKKWVSEHEEEIVVEGTKLAYYMGGLIIGSVGIAMIANHRIDKANQIIRGMEVCCGGMREGSNDTIFDVYLKNDRVHSFTRPSDGWPNI